MRVAVDGVDDVATGRVADDVAGALRALGRAVIRVRALDFLNARSIRFRHGREPEDHYADAFNTAALAREVLDPLGPGGNGRYLPAFWDAVTDRATRAGYVTAPPGAVLVVDGPYLQRPELRDSFDVRVLVDASDAAVLRQVAARAAPEVLARFRERYLPAWALYVAEVRPADGAHFVVRLNDPARPALVTNAT